MIRKIPKAEALVRLPPQRGPCLMCSIVQECEAKPWTLLETEDVKVVLSRFALFVGHLLVIPQKHCTNYQQMPAELWAKANQIAQQAACALEQAYCPARCYIASLGTAEDNVPISCSHLHLHVIPLPDPALRPHQVLTWAHGVYVADDESDWREVRERIVGFLG